MLYCFAFLGKYEVLYKQGKGLTNITIKSSLCGKCMLGYIMGNVFFANVVFFIIIINNDGKKNRLHIFKKMGHVFLTVKVEKNYCLTKLRKINVSGNQLAT